jgi:hypothetical protein
VENRLRIASPYGTASASRDPQSLGRVARLLGYSSINAPRIAKDFEEAYLDMASQIRSVFDRIVSGLT